MTHIGVVGAGAGAAAAVHTLREMDADVTILEKSRGVCGRAATRRREGCTYDYGANYVKSDDERVTALLTESLDDEGLVDVTEPVFTFDASGEITPGRDSDGHRWSYRAGLTQIAKRLLGGTDATVERGTRIETIEREADAWHLTDGDGDEWGPFDLLVCNPPAPQTAALLETAAWDDPVREELAAAVRAVPYRSIWTAVLHYPFEVDVPYYALVNTDREHDVGWLSREECKAGHVPDGESLLIVQMAPDWSSDHYDAPAEENVERAVEATAGLLDDERLLEPDWTDHQGWRYALPDAGVDTDPLAAAEAHGLYCVGDWVGGEARLHVALRNGLDVGGRIAERL